MPSHPCTHAAMVKLLRASAMSDEAGAVCRVPTATWKISQDRRAFRFHRKGAPCSSHLIFPKQPKHPTKNKTQPTIMSNSNRAKKEKTREEQLKEQQEAQEQLNAILKQTRPKNFGQGLTSGVGNIVGGAVGAVGVIVVAPVVGATAGAQSGGLVGGTLGLVGGAVAGVVSSLRIASLS